MRYKFIYILFATVLLFSSCNDWLDVNPRQEMKESTLYSTEDGFKSTLIGSYLLMGESRLYGKNTTMYIPEVLAHHWTLSTSVGATDYDLARFDYTKSGVEGLIENTWKQYYKTIVHINNILGALDENAVVFTNNNENMIKGEALGLRAFLHFDLLRYFGEIPSEANPGGNAIPYASAMTKDPNLLVTMSWNEVVTRIEKDLNEAESLLKDADPIVAGNDDTDDEWHYLFRSSRFNYYAVLATKARFYQWLGDKTKATEYAKTIIEARGDVEEGYDEGSLVFWLANESSYTNARTLIMGSELIFGIHNAKLSNIVDPVFKVEGAQFTQSEENIAIAYEAGLYPDDIRNKDRRYWELKTYQHSSTTNHFFKYTGNDLGQGAADIIPVIRLPEMYFILIENLPLEEAIPYFKNFRIARGLTTHFEEGLVDDEAKIAQLEKEYRKEFLGEGQMFFYYKRNKAEAYSWPKDVVIDKDSYVLPLPKSQLAFEK